MNPVPAGSRLLVVDDDCLLRGMAARTLRHAGFDIVEADSGEQALSVFEATPFDLVLLDVLMAGIDGFETCRRLRRLPGGARVPVLMLTGLNDTESIDRAYEAGATDFITKPIQWVLLAHRVRYGLRSAAAADAMRRSGDSLARAQRMAHMGNWELRVGGQMGCSEELARIFGAPAEAMQCASADAFLERVRDFDRERVRQARERLQNEGMPYQLVFQVERFDGVARTVFEQAAPVRDVHGRQVAAEGITQDITDRVEAERQIRHLALHDTLTGLPNRDFFLELAAPALEQARRSDSLCAVLQLDIDRFKSVNDAIGHEGGDRVLRVIAERLQAGTRGADLTAIGRHGGHVEVLARLGANAFTVMLVDLDRAEHAAGAAQRLLQAVAEPIHLAGRDVQVTASIGISLFPRDAREPAELVRFAEQALYEAKRTGRARHRFFDETMNAEASARLAREADLRRAIGNGELRLHLQPKVDAASRRIVGAEALVRWQHPERGLVPPVDFIPLAEETGLILPLTDWVLEEACSLLAGWARDGLPLVPVAVNVATPCFMSDDLVDMLSARIARHGLQPGQLMLEVTETLLMSDIDRAVARLEALRARGFRLSLDDFGTGFSSLGYLKRFPIDELKIDRSFVRDVQHGGKDGALVASIITLGRMLDLKVVAEGVETDAQAAALMAQGCQLHQGFLYARPMPAAQFRELLAQRLPVPLPLEVA
ncbi:bifunctional diguanylate cyclase/phosphodiesterase [Ideonella sp. A 288]|uniref:putative bifunctional diguanylate cyclase/phosphodiesterase n=1 Tax=Ideonella sp. A 288 TaxID=1962181 RepID=UPI000B4AAA9B|nr:EAL domain-containing protein [Ideonella sp. A 288]